MLVWNYTAYKANIPSELSCKAWNITWSALLVSNHVNWLSYQIPAHCSCFEYPCWDNGYRFGQIFMSSFNPRTVQSSVGTRAGAWRWKCPKMLILVFVWSSRDALVRSGWYVTGLSIPGTKARDNVDGVFPPSWISHTRQFREETDFYSVSVCCFMPWIVQSLPPATRISYAESLRRMWSIEVIHWAMC